MIRVCDFMPPQWPQRPAAAASRGADGKDATSWFDVDAPGAGATISGDLGLAARGLSVDQHAQRVLAQLCGEPDAEAT